MSSVVRLTRRAVIALSLAFALALMHGGIGQAMACGGMPAMPAMSTGPSALSSSMPAINAQAAGPPHQPADQPKAMHTSTCVSTPAAVGAGGSKAGPAVIGLLDHWLRQSVYRGLLPGVRPTGHEPPTPDLVSELCVIQI